VDAIMSNESKPTGQPDSPHYPYKAAEDLADLLAKARFLAAMSGTVGAEMRRRVNECIQVIRAECTGIDALAAKVNWLLNVIDGGNANDPGYDQQFDELYAKLADLKPDADSPASPAKSVNGKGEMETMIQYVTLDQIAAIVNRNKKTLERQLNKANSTMPKPDVEGGGGKPNEWKWDAIRPWLEMEFGKSLPSTYPRIR
jgi:hypothetical protein